MSKKINFSKEEDLIIKILFDRKINDIKIFDKINFDKIVKIAMYHQRCRLQAL